MVVLFYNGKFEKKDRTVELWYSPLNSALWRASLAVSFAGCVERTITSSRLGQNQQKAFFLLKQEITDQLETVLYDHRQVITRDRRGLHNVVLQRLLDRALFERKAAAKEAAEDAEQMKEQRPKSQPTQPVAECSDAMLRQPHSMPAIGPERMICPTTPPPPPTPTKHCRRNSGNTVMTANNSIIAPDPAMIPAPLRIRKQQSMPVITCQNATSTPPNPPVSPSVPQVRHQQSMPVMAYQDVIEAPPDSPISPPVPQVRHQQSVPLMPYHDPTAVRMPASMPPAGHPLRQQRSTQTMPVIPYHDPTVVRMPASMPPARYRLRQQRSTQTMISNPTTIMEQQQQQHPTGRPQSTASHHSRRYTMTANHAQIAATPNDIPLSQIIKENRCNKGSGWTPGTHTNLDRQILAYANRMVPPSDRDCSLYEHSERMGKSYTHVAPVCGKKDAQTTSVLAVPRVTEYKDQSVRPQPSRQQSMQSVQHQRADSCDETMFRMQGPYMSGGGGGSY